MLTQYGGFPAYEVMYDTGGHVVDAEAEAEALAYFGAGGAGSALTDVVLISHGWNNDIGEARTLYGDFFNAFRSVLRSSDPRSFGVLAVFWPSKKFADPSQIPGGAAALADPLAGLSAQLDQLALVFAGDPATPAKIAHAKTLLPSLAQSLLAQDDYVATLASLAPMPRYEPDEGLDLARRALAATPGHVVLQRLSVPFAPVTPPKPGIGGAAALPPGGAAAAPSEWGGAAGLNLLGGILSAAADVGDLVTYYAMKDRAGIVGRTGAEATVEKLLRSRAGGRPRLHLAGHSFGGRLVTSLANALPDGLAVDSMTLLEAAYSHNGLALKYDGTNDGGFRRVVSARKVSGPILITHSEHDTAVGLAYPLASRLAGQTADSLIGGPNDLYGGMGRNGAQHTPEADDFDLLPLGGAYPPFADGTWIRNLNGDGPLPMPTIASHGDVAKPEIALAMLLHLPV